MSDLRKSIGKYGLAEPIVCNTDMEVIGGHARLEALKAEGARECAVYLPDKKLTKKQVEELNIRLNANIAGEWDWDELAGWDGSELAEWGLDVPDFDARVDWGQKHMMDKQRNAEQVIFCIGMGTAWLERNTTVAAVEKLLSSESGKEAARRCVDWLYSEYCE